MAQRAVPQTVDVTFAGDAPPLLRFQVARDGVLLHEARPGVWVGFKRRAMVDWWDWAPIARRMNRAAVARLREELDGRR